MFKLLPHQQKWRQQVPLYPNRSYKYQVYMSSRVAKIRKILDNLNLEALFISNQANVSYISGFVGLSAGEREAFLLITKDASLFITFPTYSGLYKNEKEIKTVEISHQVGLLNWLAKFFSKNHIKTLGFEKTDVTVAELEKLKKKMAFVSFKETENVIENLRLYKDEQETARIRQACRIGDKAFSYIQKRIKPGKTERQIVLELEYFIKRNADDIAFSSIVAFGENAAIPHYFPSNNQQLTINNLILLDFGAKVDGYCSDITRVVFLGKPDGKFIKVYNTVLQAQEMALRQLKKLISDSSPSSVKTSVLDKFVKKFIKNCGFPEYPHGLGHGVGISIHEAPRLRMDSKDILSPGMVFTIEPAIYLPGWGGVRIEDLVVLKEGGIEILSKSPKLLKLLIIR